MRKQIQTGPSIRRPSRCRQRGVALVIVLWLVAVLSLAIFTTAKIINTDVKIMIGEKKAFRAMQLAEMGIAIGANPTVQETDYLLLNQQIDIDEGFQVRLKGEGGRFNINAIIQQENRDLLERMFLEWGLDIEDEIPPLIDALIDWTDADDLEALNGAEADYYLDLGITGYPFNRPFYSVDEMRLVRGMERVRMLKPNWRDYFTIYSAGRLDINEADAELIALATDCQPENAVELVRMRWGEDGIEDTEDDYVFRSMGEVTAVLGISPDAEITMAGRLTLDDTTTRIESVGQAGDFRKKIVVVVRNRSNRPQILIREEVPLF